MKYSVNSSRGAVSKLLIIAIVVFSLLIATVVIIRMQYAAAIKPVSNSPKLELLTVETGETASQIAANLKQKGLIKETWAFEWYVRSNNLRDKLQAGTYYLRPSQDIAEIAGILTSGQVATDLVTILPGRRIDQIQQDFVNSGFAPEDVTAAFKPERYRNHPALVDKPLEASLEGYLYPESFQKTPDTEPGVVITAALDELQKYLTPTIRKQFVAQGLTVHQGIILASIVEKEVGVVEDRPKVAQVFIKRLKDGMKLQSDATTTYGAILAGDEPTEQYESAYNTYQNAGLPPGPVSNVSKSSIDAVANPASTDFVYFVAGNDCKTRFSKTLEEHETFIAQYGAGCR